MLGKHTLTLMKTQFIRFLAVLAVSLACLPQAAYPKTALTDKVEPANWWVGMSNPKLQILLHGKGIGKANVKLAYPGVTLTGTRPCESPNYLFLNLEIAPSAKAGKFSIEVSLGKETELIPYALNEKPSRQNRIQGFTSADVLYLIMPDRFANGNPANDSPSELKEKANRQDPWGRHGGDLAGISNNLNYFSNLGVTALWLNPVQENDMDKGSYHGYAITDLYKIDPRLGTNEEYKAFCDKAHAQNLKVVMDLVANHIGLEHMWMKDMPFKSWVHPAGVRSNFRATIVADPYASSQDSNTMLNGWFSDHMPDLNQADPVLATYLIQNTIWWIAYSGLDGIRMDTWPYPDKTFMANYITAIEAEFPGFMTVGEVWVDDVALEAFFKKGGAYRKGYTPALRSVTDFPLRHAMQRAFNEKEGWDNGLMRLYNTLALDFQYDRPDQNVIFLDNHDLDRFANEIKSDLDKYKLALTFLLTTRGTPEIYYGMEIMMVGGGPDSEKRHDFPGGWAGDKSNVFTGQNLDSLQKATLAFTKQLLNLRKKTPVLANGKLKHFVPNENVYVYFRSNGSQTVMVVLNGNEKAKKLKTERFAEILPAGAKLKDLLTDKTSILSAEMELAPRSAAVYEISR